MTDSPRPKKNKNEVMEEGWSDLFIQKDYSTIQVSIPCYRSVRNESDELNHPGEERTARLSNVSVELACSQAASTDYDLTGQIMWPVSVLLAHYLASDRGRSILKGRRVIELGAGCGLPGLVASLFCESVVVTDGNEIVLGLLKTNASNFASQQQPPKRLVNVIAQQLIWGKRSQLEPLLQPPVDVIVAADVVQWPSVVEPLLQTVKALLWRSSVQPQQAILSDDVIYPNAPIFVLGIVNRAQLTYDQFFHLAQELGFVSRAVPLEEFLEHGVAPANCRESGGRTTEVYELQLRPDCTELPLLLQPRKHPATANADINGEEECSDDMIVGTSFENTSFLPF